jgi:hypothetical protein
LRDTPQLDDQLSTDAMTELLATLTTRDTALLTALHQYRYLDREQIQILFYGRTPRPSQRRLQRLRELGLVHMWRRLSRPGARTDEPSVWLLSRRGARLLADLRRNPSTPYIRQAADAWANCWHIDHDLEANGFFVTMAAGGRAHCDEGLFHWVGETACRTLYRSRRSPIAPDGWGRYLLPGGELVFMLEWDRGTESPARLTQKFRGYRQHFADTHNPQLTNVLVVAPTVAREQVIRRLVASTASGISPSCSFWFSHLDLLAQPGYREAVWHPLDSDQRRPLHELSLREPSGLLVEDCIAQPAWWERRLGGGEGS